MCASERLSTMTSVFSLLSENLNNHIYPDKYIITLKSGSKYLMEKPSM